MNIVIKVWRLAKYKVPVRGIVRAIRIRPLCAISLLFVIFAGIYVNSGLCASSRPVYLVGEDNYFSSMGYENGDKIYLSGNVTAISIKESDGALALNVTISRIKTETGLLLTGVFEKVSAYFPSETNIYIGQDISFSGNLSYFSHATNPGEFDYYDYAKYQGILFSVNNCKLLYQSEKYSLIKNELYKIRMGGEKVLTDYLSHEDAAIIKAMLFGNKSEISSDTKELFQKNGIAHILAISGLHISLIAMMLFALMRRLQLKQVTCMCICTLIIISYGLMVGFTVSVFRAVSMFIIFLLSKTALRTYDLLSAMSVALIFLIILRPGLIRDTGFLLSFVAVLSVGYLMATFRKNVCNFPDILNPLFVSAFVFIGTAPVIINSYYEIAFFSVLLNLVIIPLMSILLIMAIIMVLAGGLFLVIPGEAGICLLLSRVFGCISNASAKPVGWMLWLYKRSCIVLTTLHNGRLNAGKPLAWQVVIYCILIWGAVNLDTRFLLEIKSKIYLKKSSNKLFLPALSVCLILIAFFIISYTPDHNLRIFQMDIGQGDCQVIINDDGNAYMIDGGSSTVKGVGTKRVIPLLKWAGVNNIEIFLTHPDDDHMNAIMELMKNQIKEHITINHLYIYEGFSGQKDMEEILLLAREMGVEVIGLKAGDRIKDNILSFEVIHPGHGYPVLDTNNASLVLKIRYGDFCMLDTGDIEADGEKWAAINDRSDVDILKIAHHGSVTSSSEAFINAFMPEVAIISVGKKNSYGHPHKDVLGRLDSRNIKTFRTDICGCILIKAKKNGDYTVEGYSLKSVS